MSHHLRVLREAGILKMRREGTKNYYYLDADHAAMDRLLQMLQHAARVMDAVHTSCGGREELSDRKENDP